MAYESIGVKGISESGIKGGNALDRGFIKLTKKKRNKGKIKTQKKSRQKNR